MTQTITRLGATFAALVASAAIGSALAYDEGQPAVELQSYAPPTPNVEIVVNPVETPAYNYDEMNRSMSVAERQGLTLNPGAPGTGANGAIAFLGDPGAAADDFQDPDLGDDLASLAGSNVFEIGAGASRGGGVGPDDSQWDEEAYRRALEERRAALEAELEERRRAFLESEAGDATQDKLDELERERAERQRQAREEKQQRERDMTPNCCGYGEQLEIIDWYFGETEGIDEDIEQRKEEAIDEDMRRADPEANDEYREARDELDGIRQEQAENRRADRVQRAAEVR